MERKAFIKSLLGTSALITTPIASYGFGEKSISDMIESSNRIATGGLFGLKTDPIKQVRIGMIGLGNRGYVLLEMFEWLVGQGDCKIVALSDLNEKKVERAKDLVKKWQNTAPATYSGDKEEWKKLVDRDDLDLLVIATPWELHTPMCIYGMNSGKHVACEVPIAYSLADCWDLIQVAESTKKHCIMLENCCYNDEELFVLNMIENGVFGDLTHAEGAYLHDLRKLLLREDFYQDQWRIKHHVNRDGNFYTTHGLGPISFYMKIGRGDNYSHLTSMSSREKSLSIAAEKANSKFRQFKCGDMNSTMIKTSKGKTIMLQFDVHTGRPYSRINKVLGTKAVHDGYPSRLYIDPENPTYTHEWLDDKGYEDYKKKYKHPIIEKLENISKDYKQGHGGMDFVMMYRLVKCLNLGVPLDINIYDSVMWSAITPLSELSVANNSIPVPFPDFTGGTSMIENDLEIMRTFS